MKTKFRKSIKRLTSTFLTLAMVLGIVATIPGAGGWFVRADTTYSVTISPSTIVQNEETEVTFTVTKDGTEIDSLSEEGLWLYVYSDSDKLNIEESSQSLTTTWTISADTGSYWPTVRLYGDNSGALNWNDKLYEAWPQVTISDGTTDTNTYSLDVSYSPETITTSDTVTFSATAKVNGEALTELGDYHIYWWNKTSDCALDVSDGLTSTEQFTTAGTYEIQATFQNSSWTNVCDPVTVSITVTGDTVETDDTTYTISVSPSDTSVEVGDTVTLTASIVDSNNNEITDLSNFNLWWWTDSWNDHSDGNSDATYTSASASLTTDVTLPTAGTYYIVAELKDSADSTSLSSACATITVTEPEWKITLDPSSTTVESGDEVEIAATVYNEGTAIEELGDNYSLWFWIDTYNYTDGSDDATISDSTGDVLTNKVTVNSDGKYYIAVELKDSSDNSLAIEYCTITVEDDTSVQSTIDVTKVSDLSDDFIMGVDISSIISEFESGVTYKDYDGNTIDNITDFVAFMAECGVNCIRVRVWNNPTNSETGATYGGGHNTVDEAKTIADACRSAGIKMLVDFHMSDFWADPGKQNAPKAWTSMSVDEKVEAIETYVAESLKTIDSTGDVVTMVQIGNETNAAFCGEETAANYCQLFSAGAAAVRSYSDTVKVVIHVTNPESSKMTTMASILNSNNVDYDVLATSYYPYWHGTLSNLTSQLETVKSTYGKDVMVAETSYCYTFTDSDGHENTVTGTDDSDWGSNCLYEASVQGQANMVRDVIATVSAAGGIGVFYWEPAWITVGDVSEMDTSSEEYSAQVTANKAIWEDKGSGWASSAAGEYDSGAVDWYGGSAVDNEAFFAPDGTPHASCEIWNLVKTGATTDTLEFSSVADLTEEISVGGTYTLPSTVTVTYNKGEVDESVAWVESDVAAIDVNTPGEYEVKGTVTLTAGDLAEQYDWTETTTTVTYTLTVKYENLISEDLWSFEADSSNYTFSDMDHSKSDPYDETHSAHWWANTGTTGTTTLNQAISLDAGEYTFEFKAQGCSGDVVYAQIVDADGNVLATGDKVTLTGWANWLTPSVDFAVIADSTDVYVQVVTEFQDGGWGTADCLYLYCTEELDEASVEDIANQVYTGSAIEPSVTVTFDSEELSEDNYTVEYSDNVSVGEATASVTGTSGYIGTVSKTYNIVANSIADQIVADIADQTYTGSSIEPAVTVTTADGTVLAEGTDYTVEYSENEELGTATVTITGIGSYGGTVTKTFEITAASISSATVTVSPSSYTYDGSEKKPAATVKLNGETLVSGTDYTVAYKNNINAGTATVTVTGKGNYTDTATATFTIAKASLTSVTCTSSVVYSGSAVKPALTVKSGSTTVAYANYSASYSNNINVGTATVKVTGSGNYTGTVSTTFKITACSVASGTVTVSPASFTYSGSACTPSATVKLNGKTLTSGTDYTVSYSSNTDAGTATVTITGKGNYTGAVTKTFNIAAKSIASSTVTLSDDTFAYTGSAIKPGVKVALDGTTLTGGTDYSVSIKNNTDAGTATVTVTGKGNYTGTATKTFEIVKASVTYRTHVQNYGWQEWKADGASAGTTGESLRLEALNMKLSGVDGGIRYKTHVQSYGWQGWKADGAMSGTSGESKRLEAIQIELTGEAAELYDVYYRVHAQHFGWLDWAKNGEVSGTAGYSYRLESLQVVLVPKGSAAPGATTTTYHVARVRYQTHVQNVGWQGLVGEGITSGTSGKSLRLEGIRINLANKTTTGGVTYRTHVQNIGWQDWVSDGEMSGTSGQSLRLEAIQIKLTGKMAEEYDIYYRVHAQNFGWLDWAKNGESAGTTGYSYRLEAIEIVLLPKGTVDSSMSTTTPCVEKVS